MDNARIHMYLDLEKAVSSVGAVLIFLPPYSQHLNPIEIAFSSIKKWITKNANLIFHLTPELALDAAFKNCATENALNLFNHCGYEENSLNINF